MAVTFPDHPDLIGGYAPLQIESDTASLRIEGEIPWDLNGSFYRNGPNPQFAPRGDYHWFGGDGMIHAFHVENGKVSHLNRWARTIKWDMENEANESLFTIFNPTQNDPRVAGVTTNGVANTNIVWHGGKLLALAESNAPFELDPISLESKGSWNFDDKLQGPMTAHPKIDPETREMLFFGYNAGGIISEKMSFHVVDKEGNLTRSEFFDAPYAAMVHDFIATKDHVIFPIMPLTGSMDRAMRGAPVYAWEPDKGSYIGIMPRSGTAENIRWFKGDPAYVFHFMNAHTDGDTVICDVCEYDEAPFFPHADGSKPNPLKSRAKLKRWTFDLSGTTDDYIVEILDDSISEFPRLDDRFAGLKYRHGYFACNTLSDPVGRGYNALAHIDHNTGAIKRYEMSNEFSSSEPVFVPKKSSAAEGEGYLMANVYDATTDTSHLMILDAENIEQGPIGKAMLEHRVPFGFHGNWRPL
jgi:carotenoid cleavage dioxygenase